MVKIQINSLEALERLIGEDKELEIVVKESIINEFAKNHLKAVINNEFLKDLKCEIMKDLKKTDYLGILKSEKKDYFGNKVLYLSDKTAKLVKSCVLNEVDQIIRETTDEVREELNSMVRERLQSTAASVVNSIKESTI